MESEVRGMVGRKGSRRMEGEEGREILYRLGEWLSRLKTLFLRRAAPTLTHLYKMVIDRKGTRECVIC